MKIDHAHDVREWMEEELLKYERIRTNAQDAPPSLLLETEVAIRLLKKGLRIWDGVVNETINSKD